MEIQRCGPEILPAEIVSSLTSVLIRGGKVSNATYTGSQDPNEVRELIATTGGVPEPPAEGANPYFCAHLQNILSVHSVIFLGEMQTKFYCQNVGTIVIFDNKMFKFLCHMIESNHYRG